MKSLNIFFMLGIVLVAQTTFASEGGSTRGGGDIQCDNLIQSLLFQDPAGNLRLWIKNGGPEAGKLDLSSSLNPSTEKPYTYAEYDSAMLSLLNTFAKSPDVNCVMPGDKGYPVSVDDTSKICATSVDQAGIHITCDRNLFMALNTDQQIEQTHHEFAINVPGLEPDVGPISTYKISDQLAADIGSIVERRLLVTSTCINGCGPSDSLPVTELDPGSTLTLTQSINIPNSVTDVITKGVVYQTYLALALQPENQGICYV